MDAADSQQRSPPPQARGCGCSPRAILLGVLILAFLLGVATWGIRSAREAARRQTCALRLKQVWLALRYYQNSHGCLPDDVRDANGKPLLSWRVHAAQYVWYDLDFRSLLDFSDAWNSPRNLRFLKTFDPSAFRCPSHVDTKSFATDYVAIIGSGTVWSKSAPGKLRSMEEMTTAEHKSPIVVVEWPASGIHWAEPRDITVEQLLARFRPARTYPSNHRGCILYVDAAGEVGELPDDTDPETVRKLLMVTDETDASQPTSPTR